MKKKSFERKIFCFGVSAFRSNELFFPPLPRISSEKIPHGILQESPCVADVSNRVLKKLLLMIIAYETVGTRILRRAMK